MASPTTILLAPGPFKAAQLVPAALASLYSSDGKSTVLQSRNPDTLNKCTWCFDLAAMPASKKNPVELSREVTEYWNDASKTIPLSAAGLIWKEHGEAILKSCFNVPDEHVQKMLKNKFYENVVQAIDAESLHIPRCDCAEPHPSFSLLSFNYLVGTLDPDWQGMEFTAAREAERAAALQVAFDRTVAILRSMIESLRDEWYPAAATMASAFADEEFAQQRILKLSHYIPWQMSIYDEEEARGMDDTNNILWVIFQDERSLQWRATSPAAKGDRFKNRSLVHEELRGLRDQELCEKVGTSDCGFVHHTGFTCGGASLEAVLHMIRYKGASQAA